MTIAVFPAYSRPLAAGEPGEALVDSGESSCFYHPQKRAAAACDPCGRFVCALCDVEENGRHLCPGCFAGGKRQDQDRLERQRTLWDSIALSLAVFPALLIYFTIFTAPIAIYLSVRHWRTPLSILPRSKARFVAAIVIAGAELVGLAALAVVVVASIREGR